MADFKGLVPPKGTRIAIVGGCGGIGKALTLACETLDLRIAILDLAPALSKMSLPCGCISLPTDVTDEANIADSFKTLAAEWGAIDALVFVSGIAIIPPTLIEDLTVEQWDGLMSVNLRSAWLCARAAIPLMKHGGAIVTIASSLAYNPNRGFSAYVASKGGLVSLTKAIAAEYAPTIRANVVAPSAVDTPFLAGGTGAHPEKMSDEWFRKTLDSYVAMIPLRRLATPEDVVGPILFLAGPGSSYMTGQVIHVNGGRITP